MTLSGRCGPMPTVSIIEQTMIVYQCRFYHILIVSTIFLEDYCRYIIAVDFFSTVFF